MAGDDVRLADQPRLVRLGGPVPLPERVEPGPGHDEGEGGEGGAPVRAAAQPPGARFDRGQPLRHASLDPPRAAGPDELEDAVREVALGEVAPEGRLLLEEADVDPLERRVGVQESIELGRLALRDLLVDQAEGQFFDAFAGAHARTILSSMQARSATRALWSSCRAAATVRPSRPAITSKSSPSR